MGVTALCEDRRGATELDMSKDPFEVPPSYLDRVTKPPEGLSDMPIEDALEHIKEWFEENFEGKVEMWRGGP